MGCDREATTTGEKREREILGSGWSENHEEPIIMYQVLLGFVYHNRTNERERERKRKREREE